MRVNRFGEAVLYQKGEPKKVKPLPPLELLNRLFEIAIDENGLGRLKMRIDYPWHGNGRKAGQYAYRGHRNGYRVIKMNKVTYLEHRLIWKMVHGSDPKFTIDHIDRNKLNNNPANLRDVPDIENVWNRKPRLEHRHIYPATSRKGYIVSLPRLAFSTLEDAKKYRDLMVKAMIDLANKFNRSRLLTVPKEVQQCVKVKRAVMSSTAGNQEQILMPLM